MENPQHEIESVIYKLTTGSPRLQQQALESYFTPNASFQHPFCAVHGSRERILSIFRWYKILSPKIEIQVNGISYEEARQRMYIDISQTFRIWLFRPIGYRADVNLVTVLQLTRDPRGLDKSSERAIVDTDDALPSYGTNALPAATDSPFTSSGAEKPASLLPSTTDSPNYWIKSQNDLYQVQEFAKFVALLHLLPSIISFWQLFATYVCILGAWAFTPMTAVMQNWSDKGVAHRERVRRNGAFGPSLGVGGEEARRVKERDGWEVEAKARGLRGGRDD